jgi:hypothetical protein
MRALLGEPKCSARRRVHGDKCRRGAMGVPELARPPNLHGRSRSHLGLERCQRCGLRPRARRHRIYSAIRKRPGRREKSRSGRRGSVALSQIAPCACPCRGEAAHPPTGTTVLLKAITPDDMSCTRHMAIRRAIQAFAQTVSNSRRARRPRTSCRTRTYVVASRLEEVDKTAYEKTAYRSRSSRRMK